MKCLILEKRYWKRALPKPMANWKFSRSIVRRFPISCFRRRCPVNRSNWLIPWLVKVHVNPTAPREGGPNRRTCLVLRLRPILDRSVIRYDLSTKGVIALMHLPVLHLQDPYLLIQYASKRCLGGLGYPEWEWICANTSNATTPSHLTAAFNARFEDSTYKKFGFKVPTNVSHALARNQWSFRRDAIYNKLLQ